MTGFKEPQPRKGVADDAKKVIGGNWPPYVREPGLANAGEKPAKEFLMEQAGPALPDGRTFEIRKAALEAACAIHHQDAHSSVFWENIEAAEAYLRDGTKPE